MLIQKTESRKLKMSSRKWPQSWFAKMISLLFCGSVAQFPEELVTYGGNGQVLANWAQFRIVLHYLATMTGALDLHFS